MDRYDKLMHSAGKYIFTKKREMGGNRSDSPEFGEITIIW